MQYNIFQNDFYESRPGIPWAYRLTAFYGPIQDEVLTITKAIKEAHLPDQELKYYQVFFGGSDKRIPTRYQNTGTFALTFNEDCNLTAYKSILKLFRRSLDNREDDEKQYKYSNLQWELRFVVEILDPKSINLQDTKPVYGKYGLERDTNDMRVVARYEFGDCFIDKIDDIDLDYSSEEIFEWSLTVAFNSIKISYPGKKKLTLGAEDTFTETEFDAYDSYERYQKTDLSRWINKAQKKFDKLQDERTEKFDALSTYEEAVADLEVVKSMIKDRRENAIVEARDLSDEYGMLPDGSYVMEADKEAAIQRELQPILEDLTTEYKETHDFEKWTNMNVNLETMTNEEIEANLRETYKNFRENPDSEGYGLGDWDDEAKLVQAGLAAKSAWESDKAELDAESQKIEQEVRFAFKDAAVVETALKPDTNKFYEGDDTAKTRDQYAARIKEDQKIISKYEEEIQSLKHKNNDIRASRMSNEEKVEYTKANQKKMRKAEKEMKEAQARLKTLKDK